MRLDRVRASCDVPARFMHAGPLIVVILVCTVWGAGFPCMKIGLGYLPPFLYVAMRFSLATLLLLPWMARRGIPWRLPRAARPGMATVAALFVVQQSLVFLGLSHTISGRVGVLLNTQPIITAVAAHWTIEHDRLTPGKMAGLVTAALGVLVIFRESFSPVAPGDLGGDLMALAGAFIWGLQNVATKGVVRHAPPTTVTFWLCALACVSFFAASAVFDPAPVPRRPLDPTFFWTAGYVVIVATVLSFAAWMWLMERENPSRVASFCFITPVASVLSGWVMLGEPVTRDTVVGTVLVGVGIFVANFRARRS